MIMAEKDFPKRRKLEELLMEEEIALEEEEMPLPPKKKEIPKELPTVFLERREWLFDESNKMLIDAKKPQIRMPLSSFQVENIKWYMETLSGLRQETGRLKATIAEIEKKIKNIETLRQAQLRSKTRLREVL
jgi:hypothetical protein